MNDTAGSRPDEYDVLSQAAEWFALLQDEPVTEGDRLRWQQWLDASPGHRRAWARVEEIDRQFRALPAVPSRRALQAAGQSRRQFLTGLGAVLLATPLGWATWRALPVELWRADLHTTLGEIRDQALPDGGHLWLNTRSAINLDYSDRERRITLLTGEVHLHTGADPRPLHVITPQGLVQPLGTRFSVRIEEGQTRVSVSRGEVALVPQHQPEARSVVASGEVRRFDASTVSPVQAQPESETAWKEGVLVADSMPLGLFLDQLSRYRHGVIRYDAKAADLRLVGAFPLHDTDRILDAIEKTLPVKLTRLTPWWVSVEGL